MIDHFDGGCRRRFFTKGNESGAFAEGVGARAQHIVVADHNQLCIESLRVDGGNDIRSDSRRFTRRYYDTGIRHLVDPGRRYMPRHVGDASKGQKPRSVFAPAIAI